MREPGEHVQEISAISVRPMSAEDGPAARAILQQSPEASQWSVANLREAVLTGNSWVAELDGRVAGLLIGRAVADEFEILNLAVEKERRRRGVAKRLLDTALDRARADDVRNAFLEVRASNYSAIALYRQAGFRVSGQRKSYYGNPPEDAVVLALEI